MFPFVTGLVVGLALFAIILKVAATIFFSVKVKYPVNKSGAVVITGASRGIGRATAYSLAEKGYRVYAGVRKESDGKNLVSAAKGGCDIIPIILDVTNQGLIDAAVKQVAASEGDGIVGLVNNAGINVGPYPVEFLEPELLSRQLDINVVGQVRVTQAFMPLLRKKRGRIVFMSSVAGSISTAFGGAYSASKFALEAIADGLRRELVPWKMSVSVVKPAEVKTELLDKYQEDAQKAMKNIKGLGRHYYGQFYENIKPTRSKMIGELSVVTKAVSHALSSSSPKTRYVVGSKAMVKQHLQPFSFLGVTMPVWSVLPDRFFDKKLERIWPKRYKVPQQ